MNEEELPIDKLKKIRDELYSAALMKVGIGLEPRIELNVVKFTVSSFKVKKNNWFKVVKWMVQQGMASYHFGSQYVLMKLDSRALMKLNSMREIEKSDRYSCIGTHNRRHRRLASS